MTICAIEVTPLIHHADSQNCREIHPKISEQHQMVVKLDEEGGGAGNGQSTPDKVINRHKMLQQLQVRETQTHISKPPSLSKKPAASIR